VPRSREMKHLHRASLDDGQALHIRNMVDEIYVEWYEPPLCLDRTDRLPTPLNAGFDDDV
jgi:hypothetical protein